MIIYHATYNRNPCTTIVSNYSPTNTDEESGMTTIFDDLYSFPRQNLKHNILIIGVGMYFQRGKNENKKICLHNLRNRNGIYILEFSRTKNQMQSSMGDSTC